MHQSAVQHLQQLYQQLSQDIPILTQQLAELGQTARDVKRDLSSDGHLDLGTYTETLDTFASIEANNRQIDTLNARAQTAATRLAHAKLLLPQAYFAKVNLAYDSDEAEDFYLGKVGYLDAAGNDLVYDWRAPVADVYYANRIGATSYQANGRKIPVTVNQRQQFVIDHDRLIQAVDSQMAIGDPLLLAVLAANRSGGLQEITATIQTEQNAIIREQGHAVVLVDGVAGSGKTSVLLQRVAYQLYQHRHDWTPADMLIITPNVAFSRYIRGVLPALGEAEPLSTTYLNLIQALGRRFGLAISSLADNHLSVLADLIQAPHPAVPKGLTPQAYNQTKPTDSFIKRMQHAWRWLQATDQTPSDASQWLDWSALAKSWSLATLTPYDQLYLLVQITAYTQTTTAALFVDEAQDYDADVWLLLAAVFKKSQLTLVGDHRQRLMGSAPQLSAFFDQHQTINLKLTTSYRATGAITSYFSQFAGDWTTAIQAVQPQGITPNHVPAIDWASFQTATNLPAGQSLAIITPTDAEAIQLAKHFSNAHLLTATDRQTVQTGINLLSLSVAKGLEFDQVIVTGWESAFYQDSRFGQNRRYVAASRGTKALTLVESL
ncbi:UvrD-helicase domain-containing protein [Lactiplantibacillus daoliensis]|uniref:UvrD-helicase domain-containing protein n=1 Tax=Lactiplantibacillus daoliensis TaxID=2559916 RepID=A0ABW1UD31_9LACO|nr:UvrD-helicase domain-containing protein [Lactiplantibacillus daoliensis]